jgi:hypothetical protein
MWQAAKKPVHEGVQEAAMKTSLYMNLSQFMKKFSRLPWRQACIWIQASAWRGSTGCHEDKLVHESKTVQDEIQQAAMETNLYMNPSQYMKGFNRLPLRRTCTWIQASTVHEGIQQAAMKTNLYMNPSQYTKGFNRLPWRRTCTWIYASTWRGSVGCREDEPVHESKPLHERIQQAAIKTNLYMNPSQYTKGFSRLLWRQACTMNPSQYMKGFSRLPWKRQNIQ